MNNSNPEPELQTPSVIVRNLLGKSSCTMYEPGEGRPSIYILKRKLSAQEGNKRAVYSYEVVDEACELNKHLFSDNEMEYARDTAIAFFVILVRRYLSDDSKLEEALDSLIFN